ncbi:MAG: HAD family hydrolase [Cyanobacteria bacterium]|nr:HAD family hydrolase [Cyanobacteriota bacterium]MDA1021371.1 HAD family hydrolase [Cyanobacteriota bacterium]
MVIIFPDVDLTEVKAVLLDLDNCLYPYDICHARALEDCIQKLSQEFPQISEAKLKEEYEKSRKACHRRLDGTASSHSRLLYCKGLLENITGKTQAALSLELEELYWSSYMGQMQLDTKALAFLKECKNKSIPISLVTDLTEQIQLRKIIRLGIADYIDFVVSSEEAGVEKPAAKIFELALSKLGKKASEVIMIGDNLEKDIKGAEALGIKAYPVTCLESK